MPKRIHLALILDKSSSMADTKDHTISGFNEQVAQIKINAKDSPNEHTITLVTFNGDVFEHLMMAPLDQLQEADPSFYVCDGSTAMRDAVGYAITKIKAAMGPEDDILVTLISDGDENASQHYGPGQLKEEVDGLNQTGHWTFNYMGCSAKNLLEVSEDIGIPVSNMAAWTNTTAGASKRGMVGASEAIGKYLRSKSANPDAPIVEHFYTSSNDQFADFAGSADGVATNLNEAVADLNAEASKSAGRVLRGVAGKFGLVGMAAPTAHRSMVTPTSHVAPQSLPAVEDRPEDLELRVGTSDVFGKGNKAVW